ncbi:bifunctional phosphoribosyl-AMP cyclohydrolase/phosphoribosyl-ATP diphosphatase HisIE [Pseudothermotoga sp.]|nr:bifunctional phosphoribosyl-AMP cyclohydrolase/phosphoribosyl-ATP diphosphatase HisIE [Pseudothermotoga sp.]MDW8140514.1 bifunctional phosphoribosyl-AMP cyclohydrolase/phosphoribosyl-ATP diphosphatase HisIE [Pseudothermotoga sp.]
MLRPVVVQEARTGEVLMLAYADEEALNLTKETGFAHFYSRSRQKIWKKGEESGNTMRVVQIFEDCDKDALLYLVDFPLEKVACHTGNRSCFFSSIYGQGRRNDLQFLEKLLRIVQQRKSKAPESSYTAKLFREGLDEIVKKVGEEAIEVIVAAKSNDEEHFVREVADLIYHLTVLMVEKNVEWDKIIEELQDRHERSHRR